jgi:peroxiredoxin
MWTNVDDRSKHIDAAVTQIGDDADALAMAIPSAIYAYRLDGRDDEIEPLTERLLAKLDTDERRSEVLCELAENCVLNNLREEARELCERVIALDASDYAVRRCRGLLHELDNLNVGQIAPTFSAPGLDGGEVNLASLRGKAVLLDFWATWCAPCIGEFPHLRRVHEKFSGTNFTIISISLDDDCNAARKKIASERLAWTHVCEGWQESKIARLYNVMGIPSTWLIAPDGTIAAKDLRGHAVDKAVGELLGRAQLD